MDGLCAGFYLRDDSVFAGEAGPDAFPAAGLGIYPAVVGLPVGGIHGLSVVSVIVPHQKVVLLHLLLLTASYSFLLVPQLNLQVFEGYFLVDHAHQ